MHRVVRDCCSVVFSTFDMTISSTRIEINLCIVLCSFCFASFIQRCGKFLVYLQITVLVRTLREVNMGKFDRSSGAYEALGCSSTSEEQVKHFQEHSAPDYAHNFPKILYLRSNNLN